MPILSSLQHKIYILEKAYDFIAEKNSPRLGTNDTSGNEKQDAFTQSGNAGSLISIFCTAAL